MFYKSLDAAKRASYRSANAIFSKIGRIASEEVTLQLIPSKSVPLLLYGLEACPLNKLGIERVCANILRSRCNTPAVWTKWNGARSRHVDFIA